MWSKLITLKSIFFTLAFCFKWDFLNLIVKANANLFVDNYNTLLTFFVNRLKYLNIKTSNSIPMSPKYLPFLHKSILVLETLVKQAGVSCKNQHFWLFYLEGHIKYILKFKCFTSLTFSPSQKKANGGQIFDPTPPLLLHPGSPVGPCSPSFSCVLAQPSCQQRDRHYHRNALKPQRMQRDHISHKSFFFARKHNNFNLK